MPETAPIPEAGGPPSALLRALRRLLGPLVRLLLAHQVTYPVLTQLLKRIYIEEADRAFAIPGKPQTISRLTLLTGIHRKDVKRIQAEPSEPGESPGHVSLGAQLVLRWTAEPQYRGPDGEPVALPRAAGDLAGPSFESLVESVSKDIRPRAILDEWLRLGIATVDEEDRVHLRTGAFVPSSGFDEKAHFFGRNLHDHMATSAHNLTSGGEGEAAPMLERSVYYARLRPESVAELESLATEAGMEALQKINQRALVLQRADDGDAEADRRMNFGVYFHRARLEADDADPARDEESSDAD